MDEHHSQNLGSSYRGISHCSITAVVERSTRRLKTTPEERRVRMHKFDLSSLNTAELRQKTLSSFRHYRLGTIEVE